MNTYLSNINLEARIFDSLAASLQEQDPQLLPLSGQHASLSKTPAALALLIGINPQMTKVALINIRNCIEALAHDSRGAQVWRRWRSVLLVQCCLRPTAGADPLVTSTLLNVASEVFPKRAKIHLVVLEYTLDLQARKIQSYRIFDQDDPALCAGLLTQTVLTVQDAGVTIRAEST